MVVPRLAAPGTATVHRRAPATLPRFMLDTWPAVKDAFPDEVRAEYVAKFRDPDTVHAVCEEFRAFATLDFERDEKRPRQPQDCLPGASPLGRARISRADLRGSAGDLAGVGR
jgi:hypothetical protein